MDRQSHILSKVDKPLAGKGVGVTILGLESTC
jgi:hypothetical protein